MYSDEERALLAGYDNGDIKMFDLRTNKCACSRTAGHGDPLGAGQQECTWCC